MAWATQVRISWGRVHLAAGPCLISHRSPFAPDAARCHALPPVVDCSSAWPTHAMQLACGSPGAQAGWDIPAVDLFAAKLISRTRALGRDWLRGAAERADRGVDAHLPLAYHGPRAPPANQRRCACAIPRRQPQQLAGRCPPSPVPPPHGRRVHVRDAFGGEWRRGPLCLMPRVLLLAPHLPRESASIVDLRHALEQRLWPRLSRCPAHRSRDIMFAPPKPGNDHSTTEASK